MTIVKRYVLLLSKTKISQIAGGSIKIIIFTKIMKFVHNACENAYEFKIFNALNYSDKMDFDLKVVHN